MSPQVPDRRLPSERFWIKYYNLLFQRGYELRPRYGPDWVPSWITDNTIDEFLAEDSLINLYGRVVLDARRISDNQKVILKRVKTKKNEIKILEYLSQPHLRNNTRNHSTPLLDVIPLPDDDSIALVVMPYLMRMTHLPFRHVGEVAEALEQLFEAVAFLHEHDIIHGDVCYYNFLVDGSKMVPDGWHFGGQYIKDDGFTRIEWTRRWLTRPNRYYLTDYDLSHQVKDDEDRWIGGVWGQDRTVPEMSGIHFCDGFKVDIYQMGNLINQLIQEYTGLEAFQYIANKLTAKDPNMRPSAASAVHLLRYHLKVMSQSDMNSWIWRTGILAIPWKRKMGIKYFGTQSIR